MTTNKTAKKVQLSRPKDKSFEAFKAWFDEAFRNITGRGVNWTPEREAEVRETWKKFWADD